MGDFPGMAAEPVPGKIHPEQLGLVERCDLLGERLGFRSDEDLTSPFRVDSLDGDGSGDARQTVRHALIDLALYTRPVAQGGDG